MNSTQIINLDQILVNTLPQLALDKDQIVPDYESKSIANLPSSICEWLGVPGIGQKALSLPANLLPKKPYKHVILVLVDALGLDSFLSILQNPTWKTFAAGGHLATLTSVVPSTTTSALTSLWTGCTPLEHGITGYEMLLKESGLIANMITFAPSVLQGEMNLLRKAGFQPESFLPVPTLSQHLKRHKINVHAFQPAPIARSSLSTMLMPGAEIHPYRTLSDMWVSLEQHLYHPTNNPSYTWVYWGDYDDLGHQYGPDDSRLVLELEHFGKHLQHFLAVIPARVRAETLIVLTADHGMISTETDAWYDLHSHLSVWNDLIMPPSGENRFAYLYPHNQSISHLQADLIESWGDDFQLVSSSIAMKAGLFGRGIPHPSFSDRIGEYILVARKNAYIWWAKKENNLRGRHGGLSRQEMLVPLFFL